MEGDYKGNTSCGGTTTRLKVKLLGSQGLVLRVRGIRSWGVDPTSSQEVVWVRYVQPAYLLVFLPLPLVPPHPLRALSTYWWGGSKEGSTFHITIEETTFAIITRVDM